MLVKFIANEKVSTVITKVFAAMNVNPDLKTVVIIWEGTKKIVV